jgi:hypothetical protein
VEFKWCSCWANSPWKKVGISPDSLPIRLKKRRVGIADMRNAYRDKGEKGLIFPEKHFEQHDKTPRIIHGI